MSQLGAIIRSKIERYIPLNEDLGLELPKQDPGPELPNENLGLEHQSEYPRPEPSKDGLGREHPNERAVPYPQRVGPSLDLRIDPIGNTTNSEMNLVQ